ncbi:MAG: TIR domain-containing protein [Candidatus Thiodiazotropha endolucinida]
MDDIFISYSRVDTDFVVKLRESLTQRDFQVWVDQDSIPYAVEWRPEIQQAIDSAQAVIFVISPESAASAECEKEINYALLNYKRLIPIVYRPVDPSQVPQQLRKLNWLPFDQGEAFTDGLEKLIETIETDHEWVRLHTRLHIRAREWDSKERNSSYVLRGDDLISAEEWLKQSIISKEPASTELQKEYIEESRRFTTRIRRRAIVVGSIGLFIVLSLAVLFFIQRTKTADNFEQAQANHRRTVALNLASEADNLVSANPQLAILLAAEGMRITQRAGEQTVQEVRGTLAKLLTAYMARPMAEVLTGSYYSSFSVDSDSIVFASSNGLHFIELDAYGLSKSYHSIPWSKGRIQRTYGPVGNWFMVQAESDDENMPTQYLVNLESNEIVEVDAQPVALTLDGRWLIVVEGKYTVRLMDTKIIGTELPLSKIGEHWGDLEDMVFTDDGNWLAILDRDLTPNLIDLRNLDEGGAGMPQKLAGSAGIRLLRFSANSRWLAAADTDNSLAVSGSKIDLWRRDNNAWRIAIDKKDFLQSRAISMLDVSTHGNWLAVVGWKVGDSGDNDRGVTLWHLGDESYRAYLTLPEEVNHITFSSDDRWIAAASRYDSKVRIWDLNDYAESKRDNRELRMMREFDVKGRGVSSLGFFKNRNALLVLAAEPVVWDFDLSNPEQQPFTFFGRRIETEEITFAPDKDWLVTLDEDGPPWLWMFEKPAAGSGINNRYAQLSDVELLSLARQVAGRNLTRAEWSEYISSTGVEEVHQKTFSEFEIP